MQTRAMSLVESCANIAIGYAIAVAANAIVLPLFGFHTSTSDNFLIGAIFTAISLVRSYTLRRIFNHGRKFWLGPSSLKSAANTTAISRYSRSNTSTPTASDISRGMSSSIYRDIVSRAGRRT